MDESKIMLHETSLEALKGEGYYYRWYFHFLASLALKTLDVISVTTFKSGPNRETMIIYAADDRDYTMAHKVSGKTAQMKVLEYWLRRDFGEELEFNRIEKEAQHAAKDK